MTGLKHSEETKAKISAARKGKPAFKNKKHPEESKAKIAAARTSKIVNFAVYFVSCENTHELIRVNSHKLTFSPHVLQPDAAGPHPVFLDRIHTLLISPVQPHKHQTRHYASPENWLQNWLGLAFGLCRALMFNQRINSHTAK